MVISNLPETLRRRGIQPSAQRLAVAGYVLDTDAHPSAEQVWARVRERFPMISRATVYNTLNTLAKAGAVRELTIDPERRRYDPDTSLHHHLICVGCKKVVDVPGDVAVEIPKNLAKDFTVFGNHVEFYGYCLSCRKKKKQ